MNTKPNPYLEKAASLTLAAAGHLLQNLSTNSALHTKKFAKYVANSFAQGTKGVVDSSHLAEAKRAISSVVTPDIAAAGKKAHDAGRAMAPVLSSATKRQKAGIRMLTEGRIDDLVKYNLHVDPVVLDAHKFLSRHVPGVPSPDSLTGKRGALGRVKALWADKSHPLLSNVLKNITRGDNPVGDKFKPGKISQRMPVLASVATTLKEPVAGSIDLAKNMSISEKFQTNKYGKKVVDAATELFVKSPVRHGLEAAKRGVAVKGIGHEAYKFLGNPVSAHLKRTTAALREAVEFE